MSRAGRNGGGHGELLHPILYLDKSFRKKEASRLLSISMNSNMQTPERKAIMQMQD